MGSDFLVGDHNPELGYRWARYSCESVTRIQSWSDQQGAHTQMIVLWTGLSHLIKNLQLTSFASDSFYVAICGQCHLGTPFQNEWIQQGRRWYHWDTLAWEVSGFKRIVTVGGVSCNLRLTYARLGSLMGQGEFKNTSFRQQTKGTIVHMAALA